MTPGQGRPAGSAAGTPQRGNPALQRPVVGRLLSLGMDEATQQKLVYSIEDAADGSR